MHLKPFPELCPACTTTAAVGFCHGCERDFQHVADPCHHCGLPRPVVECPRAKHPWHVNRVIAPYTYSYPLNHYLQSLKFRHGRHLGRALGLLLAESLKSWDLSDTILIAVPLHAQRLHERGYNQAYELTRTLAAQLGLSIRISGIARRKTASPQSTLGAKARWKNLADAYQVTRRISAPRVLLVDDVITTGATVNALASILLTYGAVRVDAVAIARTLPNTGNRAATARWKECDRTAFARSPKQNSGRNFGGLSRVRGTDSST